MNQISLSIVTATYNRVYYLKKNYLFLKKNKNLFNFEWIIVCEDNDFKTKNFLKKIKKDNFIKVVFGSFKSADKAYNEGFKKAKGKYLNIHGDDDFFCKKNFPLIKKFLKSDKEWIIGQSEYINSNFQTIRPITSFFKKLLLKYFNKNIISLINYIMTPSVFFKKELLKKVGGYDDKILFGSDYIFWLKFNKLYNPYVVNKKISYVIYDRKTKTGSFDFSRYYVFLKKMKHYTTGPTHRFFQIFFILIIITINYFCKKIIKIY